MFNITILSTILACGEATDVETPKEEVAKPTETDAKAVEETSKEESKEEKVDEKVEETTEVVK